MKMADIHDDFVRSSIENFLDFCSTEFNDECGLYP